MTDRLRAYAEKRDFTRTSEPQGGHGAATGRRFVVQKHAATRLHWDFRLEWNGVLLSWAVTRGPSSDPSAKRLAVRTEDHPVDYAGFEGTIPKGEYGGGTVMLWDQGTWAPLADVDQGLAEGSLKVMLLGERMRGAWALVRMKPRAGETRENWLLIKERDAGAEDDPERLVTTHMTSVTTGRSMAAIAKGDQPRPPKPKKNRTAVLPVFRPLQLATLAEYAPEGDGWLHEVKFDGYRCLAAVAGREVRLYTRSGLDWTTTFAALVPAFAGLPVKSALIDGEVISPIGGAGAFADLQARLDQGGALAFMAFDLLEVDGKDITAEPLHRRKDRLEALLRDSPDMLRYSTHLAGNGQAAFDHVCAAGGEGIIAKRADAPYRGGRQAGWQKIKCQHRQEFILCGWKPSTAAGRPFASLLLASREGRRLVYRGALGTGFKTRDFEQIMPLLQARRRATCPLDAVPPDLRGVEWARPDLVVEVGFAGLTGAGLVRHGVYQGLRRDKPAKAVRLETAEVAMTDMDAAGPLGVRLTSPKRLVYADPPVTKLAFAQHLADWSDRMLPFLRNRPLSLLRCPDGIPGQCFFQKHHGAGLPDDIDRAGKGATGAEDYVAIADAEGLVAAAQMGTMEFHIWGAQTDDIELPDRLVFDLDPDEGLGFTKVRQAAADLGRLLSEIGLPSVPMLTGGKGVHVIVALKPSAEWPTVKLLARTLASHLADTEDDRFTASMSKSDRKGRIFIDWLRNERGATAIAPWSPRARPGAGVAVPLAWDELAKTRSAAAFDIASVAARLKMPCPLLAARGKAVTLGARVLGRLEKRIG